jgi:hypothetical protein
MLVSPQFLTYKLNTVRFSSCSHRSVELALNFSIDVLNNISVCYVVSIAISVKQQAT